MNSKDPNTAFVIELVGGFFGLLGLGYFYVGRTNDGIVRLLLWLLYDVIAFCVISALLAVVVGIACIPIQLIIQIGVPLWSALSLKKQLLGSPAAPLTSEFAHGHGAAAPPPLVLPPHTAEYPPYPPATGATVALRNAPTSAHIVPGPNESWTCSVCSGYIRADAAFCKHCNAAFR